MLSDPFLSDRLQNDDITGYLFARCMEKIARRELPTEEELEAANIELQEIGLRITYE